MTITQIRERLRALRLDRGWSFDRLAADVRDVMGQQHAMSGRTLHRLDRDEHVKLHDTTKYALEQYLQATRRKGAA